ncbi:MAG: hypothetical protein EB127_04780 [Alphaproteobacteria bacterium]|nr:hypothetical protein [Alphaproteobacteria bacterium]
MKLDEKTLEVLKNFSAINTGIYFRPGKILRVINPSRTFIGKAQIQQEIESQFGIYDINRFLSVVSMLDDPEIKIKLDGTDGNGTASITANNSKILYRLAADGLIVVPPDKDLKLQNPEVNFTLKGEALTQVLKAAGILGLPEIVISGDRNKIKLSARDTKQDGSDSFSVDVGSTKAKFDFVFKFEIFKMLHLDFDVSITSKGYAQFTSPNLTYWAAMENTSRYEA